MKTFIFLLCSTVFGFSPVNSFSQEKITINSGKKVSIHQVFRIIKKQTNYRFLYPEDLFKDNKKVQLKKGVIQLTKLLKQSFSGSNITFEISKNNTIVIEKSESTNIPIKENKQEIKITGIVVDKTGSPLPGASVIEKGTTNGTETDFDGNFSISVKNQSAIVMVRYLGYASFEVPVKNNTKLTIVLEEDADSLEEIVVVAYGQKKKYKRNKCNF